MKAGKLITIGESQGVVIHREYLRELGWFKGDYLVQEIRGKELIIYNAIQRKVQGAHERKAYGDGAIGRGSPGRGV